MGAVLLYAPRMGVTILASNIRALRKHLGLTQAEFATEIGDEQPNVSRWESKGTIPDALALHAIASRANWPVQQFINVAWAPGAAPQKVERAVEPPPAPVLLPVSLPSEEALTDMFQALLGSVGLNPDEGGRAQTLARHFPDAFRLAASAKAEPRGAKRKTPAKGARARGEARR